MQKTLGVLAAGLFVLALAGCPRPLQPRYAAELIPLDDVPIHGGVMNNALRVAGTVYSVYHEGDARAAVWDGEDVSLMSYSLIAAATDTYGRAVSEGGVLAAHASEPRPYEAPFRYGMLWAFGDTVLGACDYPFAVNDNLESLGTGMWGTVPFAELRLENNSVFLTHPATDAGGVAFDMNGQYEIVGSATGFDGVERARLWSHDEERVLEGLGGSFSRAESINELGMIAGTSLREDNETFGALVWHFDTIIELDTLGGADAAAHDINESGNVVGWSTDAEGNRRAALWKRTCTNCYRAVNLNTMLRGNENIVLTEAFSINDNGHVVAKGTKDGEPAFFLVKAIRPIP